VSRLNRNKQKTNPNSLIESIYYYFFIKFCAVSGCFGLFRFVSVCFETVCFDCLEFYTETASFDVSIEPKQTEDLPKQFDREHILVFFRKFRVVSLCCALMQNSSVCFGCFKIGSKHRNKPKKPKQILFQFFSVQTEIFFLFRGHPTFMPLKRQCHGIFCFIFFKFETALMGYSFGKTD
jgi:hypothetical protein